MPDNNAAIILTLFLVFVVIGLGAYCARVWIKSFIIAMLHTKQAERESAV